MVMIWSPACVSISQLQLTVDFLESLIWIMQEVVIHPLSLTGNCMQLEKGELRFYISLYEIFVNLDFKIQSMNTIRERTNGVKSEKLT